MTCAPEGSSGALCWCRSSSVIARSVSDEAIQSLQQPGLLRFARYDHPGSIERYDLDPVCALAGRVLANLLQRARLGIDRIAGDRVRLLARHDGELAARIDGKSARLLLGRRARHVSQLAGRAVDLEAPERARRALGRIEELAVRRQMQVGRPDVVRRVARRLPGAHRTARLAGA